MMKDSPAQQDKLFSFQFKAMNTTVSCTLPDMDNIHSQRMQNDAISWFQYTEKRFSRFLPTSELTYLNRSAGAECLVSSAMLEVLHLAASYRKQTEGVFNPFVLDALLRSGYDKSFEQLPPADSTIHPASAGADTIKNSANARAAILHINPYMQSVRFTAGTSMDLGGIVKSWAVKRLAAWFQRQHAIPRGLVNAGGDLAVWGGGPATAAQSWRVGIQDPWTANSEIGTLLLQAGASATSGTLGRRWAGESGTMHHLIHPATMRPAHSDVVQCTTSGEDPIACEIWAKTLCIVGSEAGLALLSRARAPIEALLFGCDRDIIFYGDIRSIQQKWLDVPISRTVPA